MSAPAEPIAPVRSGRDDQGDNPDRDDKHDDNANDPVRGESATPRIFGEGVESSRAPVLQLVFDRWARADLRQVLAPFALHPRSAYREILRLGEATARGRLSPSSFRLVLLLPHRSGPTQQHGPCRSAARNRHEKRAMDLDSRRHLPPEHDHLVTDAARRNREHCHTHGPTAAGG